MARSLRISAVLLVVLGALFGAGVVAILVMTRTDWGVERVRRFAVSRVGQAIDGSLDVQRVTTVGLLGGATLHDVSIDDPLGRPFVRLDSVSVRYNLLDLVRGRIVLDSAQLWGAQIYLERLPGDTRWNFERVFGGDDDEESDSRRLILFRDARIHGGEAVVRFPWSPEPGERVEPGDTARLILREVPGGLVRELRFESVNAVLPRVLWETPEEEGRLVEIGELAALGYIWEDPFEVRRLEGTVTLRDSVITFEAPTVVLPESRASAIGQYVTGDERHVYDIRIDADTVTFRDLQWLYPRFPDEGGGRLVLRIQSQDPSGTLWLAEGARLSAPGTNVAGSFGIVVGDTLYFTRVDLRASPLNLDLLASMLPSGLPVEGLLVGTVVLEGPISSLTTRGDLRLSSGSEVPSSVRWSGTFDLRAPYGVRNLEADVRSLDLELLSALGPRFPVSGRVSGRLEATGQLDGALRFSGLVRHEAGDGPGSEIEAWGTVVDAASRPALDVEMTIRPLALDALAASVPALAALGRELKGELRGPARIRGPLSDLEVVADLDTSAGEIGVTGRFDLEAPEPRYMVGGHVSAFRLHELLLGLPRSEFSGDFRVEGRGTDPATAAGDLFLALDPGNVAGVEVRGARLRLSVEDGIAHVDTLLIETGVGRLNAYGQLGLTADRAGELQFEIVADSLSTLRPVLFPDTGFVFVDNGAPDAPEMAGSVRVSGRLSGHLGELDAAAEAVLSGGQYGAFRASRAVARIDATSLRRDSVAFLLEAEADSLAAGGRLITSVRIGADYAERGGAVHVTARAPEDQTYRLTGEFDRTAAGFDFRIEDLGFRSGDAGWELTDPFDGFVSRDGLRIDALELRRTAGAGRLRAGGWLPWLSGAEESRATTAADDSDGHSAELEPADFRVEFDQLRLADFIRIANPYASTDGFLSGRVDVKGVPASPIIDGVVGLSGFRYGDLHVDRFSASLGYADRRLNGRIEAHHEGRRILEGEGQIPLNLALAAVEERRLDEPLGFTVRADSVPAVLLTSLLDGFYDVSGRVDGELTVGGTTRNPELGGQLTLRGGSAFYLASGVRYRNVEGVFQMLENSVVQVDASARTADGGRATVSGTLTFRPIDDPQFDLRVLAQEFEAARRRDVEMVGSGEVSLTGRYSRPVLSGYWHVDRGALYLDELLRQYQIVDLAGPLLFDVVDTSRVAVRQLLGASDNPFLRNLIIENTTVDVGRDFWLRSPEMNVEVTGSLAVTFNRTAEDLRLTGTLDAVRGVYQFYVQPFYRRFQIRSGTVEFLGTPGIDPNLDFTAVYRTRTDGEPLDVIAVVSGTLQSPRVRLTSETEPPISESDLASYLIFGRPTWDLARSETRALGAAGLGFDAVAPGFFLGGLATGLETMARSVGIDYLAITSGEFASEEQRGTSPLGGLFAGTRVEVGQYLSENLYLALSQRLTGGTQSRSPSARLEWRFLPTWTAEFFWEDRFARSPYLGFETTQQPRKAYGFFLFREWGY